MMKLCELYKFPTLAVKTFLHMRKYKIDITPITYSYYNRVSFTIKVSFRIILNSFVIIIVLMFLRL
jgi:hypothetical protein